MIFSTLLNIKFACEKCQNGHRNGSCTHIDRQLLEIKQKGRPASQCGHCRSKRRQGVGHSHHRCLCGDSANFVKKKVEATFEPSTVRLVFTPDKNNVAGIQKLLEEQPQSSLVISKKAKIARDALSESGNDSPLTPNLDPSATLLTITYTGLKVIEESYGLDYEKMISNPCKCQFGGSCVCSEIAAQSASKRSRQNSSATPPVVPPPAVHAATGAHLQGRFEKPAYEQLEFPADMVPGIANGSVPMSIAPARQSNMQPMSSPSALHSVVSSPAAPYHAMSPSQFGHLSTTSTNIFPMDMPQSMDGMFSPAAMAGSLQHAVYASENLNSLGGFGAAPSAVQQLNVTDTHGHDPTVLSALLTLQQSGHPLQQIVIKTCCCSSNSAEGANDAPSSCCSGSVTVAPRKQSCCADGGSAPQQATNVQAAISNTGVGTAMGASSMPTIQPYTEQRQSTRNTQQEAASCCKPTISSQQDAGSCCKPAISTRQEAASCCKPAIGSRQETGSCCKPTISTRQEQGSCCKPAGSTRQEPASCCTPKANTRTIQSCCSSTVDAAADMHLQASSCCGGGGGGCQCSSSSAGCGCGSDSPTSDMDMCQCGCGDDTSYCTDCEEDLCALHLTRTLGDAAPVPSTDNPNS